MKVGVHYSTLPESAAIQWLDPEQTSGKVHPYLFTQCQAIHGRELLPCQDTPSVKFTYAATVRAPSPLTALMSALQTETAPSSGHCFGIFEDFYE